MRNGIMIVMGLLGITSGACLEDPAERSVTLGDLSGLRMVYTVEARNVRVWLEHLDSSRACALLGSDFEGRVNDMPMTVISRGGADEGSITDECHTPHVALALPPSVSVSPASFTLLDRSRVLTCALGDSLLPRSVTLVPDGPWMFSPGQEITVRWSPASDLAKDLAIRIDDVPTPIPFTVQGDLVTFTMPSLPLAFSRQIHFSTPPPPVCQGGKRIGSSPAHIARPFTYRSGP